MRNGTDRGAEWKLPTAKEMRSGLAEISISELTEALAGSGLRKHGKFSEWTEWRLGLLKEFHITADIQKLVDWGINKETLNLSLVFINMAQGFDYFLKDMFGDKRTRLRNARSLATAAAVLESMNKLVPGMPDMPGNIPKYRQYGEWREELCRHVNVGRKNLRVHRCKFNR